MSTREGRTRFIEHRGRRILLIDLGFLAPEGVRSEIEFARGLIGRLQPDGSLLVCTDGTGAQYDHDTVQALGELSKHNAPYVKASATVVESGLKRAATTLVGMISRRRLHAFATRDEALDWLAGQA
jgi:hypothetical protein